MIAVIDQHILPALGDDFSRGQAYGVVYMLRCVRKQASWSSDYLVQRIGIVQEVSAALEDLFADVDGAPLLPRFDPAQRLFGSDGAEAAYLTAIQEICTVYDWFELRRETLPEPLSQRIEATLRHFMTRQLKNELATGVAINFSEISSGRAAASNQEDI